MRYETDYSLLSHNTFGIPCTAAVFAEYTGEEELRQLLASRPERLLHIGSGSNLLFLKPRFEGLVLHSVIRTLEVVVEEGDEVLLRVGAGWDWDTFVAHTLTQGWYGLENLSLIPGEVGASAVQNVGAYGAEAGEFIHSVEAIHLHTLERRTFSPKDCDYAYRHSFFKRPAEQGCWAVLYVTYRLSTCFRPRLDYGGIRSELERLNLPVEGLTAQQLRQAVVSIRRHKLPDPKEQGSAGSFFKNPIVPRTQYEALAAEHPLMPYYDMDAQRVKIPAGWLIEQCGWKGRTLGTAGVHPRQALVLVNLGEACGSDVLALCRAIQGDVRSRFGIALEPEVNFIL